MPSHALRLCEWSGLTGRISLHRTGARLCREHSFLQPKTLRHAHLIYLQGQTSDLGLLRPALSRERNAFQMGEVRLSGFVDLSDMLEPGKSLGIGARHHRVLTAFSVLTADSVPFGDDFFGR